MLEPVESDKEVFNQIFIHNSVVRIIVCKSCGYGVSPESVERHLKRSHAYLQPTTKRRISQYVAELDHLAWRVEDVQWPTEHDEPIVGVPVKTDCAKCDLCSKLYGGHKGVMKHLRDDHGWQSGKGQGGSLATRLQSDRNQMWTSGHAGQELFPRGTWRRLTAVNGGTGRSEEEGGAGRQEVESDDEHTDRRNTSDWDKAGEQLLEEFARKKAEHAEGRLIRVPCTRSQVNPWLTHTGWPRHLAKLDSKKLKASLQIWKKEPEKPPGPNVVVAPDPAVEVDEADEAALETACDMAKQVICKGLAICSEGQIPRTVLHFVNRREGGAKNNEMPFYAGHKPDTIRKYAAVLLKIIRYLWRSQQWEKRPAYRLTKEQESAFTVMKTLAQEEAERRAEEAARKERRRAIKIKKQQQKQVAAAVVDFWMSMLQHELTGDEFDSGLISAVAVLGLDSQDGGWQRAEEFTPSIAAIVTVCRVFTIYQAWQARKDEIRELRQMGQSPEEAGHDARQIYSMVAPVVRKWLTLHEYAGVPGPFERLLHMKTYGMTIRFNSRGHGRVSWVVPGMVIGIDQLSIDISTLKESLHNLQEKCWERLVEKLAFIEKEAESYTLPPLDIERLVDNPNEEAEDWNFLQDSRNVKQLGQVDPNRWLWRRMMRETDEKKQLVRLEDHVRHWSEVHFRLPRVEDYFREVQAFKEELIVLCHMTGGAPARGTEVTSLQHENAADRVAVRGVFIDQGQVVLVTRYHKGFSFNQQIKEIHRYLPKEIGELVVYYLWLIEPFVRQLQGVVRGQMEFSPWLWEPKPEKRWDGGEGDFADVESDSDGAVSGDDRADEMPTEGDEDDSDVEDRRDEEEHQRKEARRQEMENREPLNVDGFWATERLKRCMKREMVRYLGQSITPSQWRHVYIAMQREFCEEADVSHLLDQIYRGVADQDPAMPSGHSHRMEDLLYGALSTASPHITDANQRRFRKLSQQWHQVLQFPSAMAERTIGPVEVAEQQKRWEAARWQKLRTVNLQAKLREMMGERARFRGQQWEVLQAIMRREPRILAVMGTGAGKSLLFQLPAFCSPEGVTIVVVPFESLEGAQYESAKGLGLRAGRWRYAKERGTAQVLFITPESAGTKAFGRFLLGRMSLGQLDRIFIDETHVALDSVDDWRPKVLDLAVLAGQRCQVVYVTATLPPGEEATYRSAMGLEGSITQFRGITTRPNIYYQVQEYDSAELKETLQQLIPAKLAEYPTGQIIVYCRTIEECVGLAREMGYPAYHANVGTAEEKKRLMDDFVKGVYRVIFGSNAMSVGISADGVAVAIHTSVPRRMKAYGQESGRVGRQGQPSEAIILRGVTTAEGQRHLEGANARYIQRGMKDFVEGRRCRRIPMDRELDGRTDRVGCETGERRCDVCRGRRVDGRRMVVRHPEGDDPAGDEEEEGGGEGGEPDDPGDVVVDSDLDDGFGVVDEQEFVDMCSHVETRAQLPTPTTSRKGGRAHSRAALPETPIAPRRPESGVEAVVSRSATVSFGSTTVGSPCPSAPLDPSLSTIPQTPPTTTRPDKRPRSVEVDEEEGRAFFERSRRIHEEAARNWTRSTVDGLVDPDELKRKFRDWSRIQCVICWARGVETTDAGAVARPSGRDPWKQCPYHDTADNDLFAAVEREIQAMITKKKVIDDSTGRRVCFGCFWCLAPQSICHRWKQTESAQGSKTAMFILSGQRCQSPQLIRELVAAVVSQRMNQGDEGPEWAWVRNAMTARVGFMDAEGDGERPRARLWRFFQQRVVSNQLEMNEMVRMLYFVA